ncbi:M42 family metallopeptidase [Caldisphaera sp.]|uniref:M42 family metallopeptidase n=1 Tax=Caldisphaera sp. TaxID=2060322 RepID=UPI0025C4A5CE|nr:M42 family metallopeptidase [Caldisphaera sp.]
MKSAKDEIFEILKKLTYDVGISGYEDNIRGMVIDELKNYADSLEVDSLGNVIAVKKGSKSSKKLMIAAHMDEIGLMISYIDERGFLKFAPVGGITERTLLGQKVKIITKDNKIIKGVIGLKPPHIMKPEEAKQVPDFSDLYIDIGFFSKDEVLKNGIDIGSIVSFDRELERIGNGDIVTGKSLDDRAGLAAMIQAFKNIDNNEVNIYAVATVQEEVGLKGAKVSAFRVEPDIAIALDVTIASDVPSIPEGSWVCKLNQGPAIKLIDGQKGTGLIANKKLVDFVTNVANKYNVPYQLEVLTGGTTDASAMNLNKEGVPSIAISIPARYIHSPVEVVSLNDLENTSILATKVAKEMNEKTILNLINQKIK